MTRWLRVIVATLACGLLLASPAPAEEEGAGHMHGPDGRHVAAPASSGASGGGSILSHHDLMIIDTRKFSPRKEGAVVEGCDVHSVVYRKGDRSQPIHREHNSYEPENGVYGSHMMYREPGEYEIIENVTLPDGTKYSLTFPVWVPDPHGGKEKEGTSPLLLGLAGLAVLGLALLSFFLGRRSGRRAAAGLTTLTLLLGLVPLRTARAGGEEAGHMHGPDGRHIAVAENFGTPSEPLRAYPAADLKETAEQRLDPYLFRLAIENEELAPPDPDLVTLAPAAAQAIDLRTATATTQRLGGGLSTTGQVRPNPNGVVTVSSRVAGRVTRINVTPGQEIPAGHLVAEIDSTEVADAQAALSRAQAEQRQAEAARGHAAAEVRRAQSQVAETETGLERVQAQREEAVAEVEQALADLEVARGKAENARKALARQQQLAATGAFAQGPVEAARSTLAAAEGEVREAQSALAAQEAQVRRLEQGLKAGVTARKELEAGEAMAAQVRTRLSTATRQVEIARTALIREERIQRENLRDAREVQTAQAEVDAAQLTARSADAAVTRQRKAVQAAEALVAAGRRAVETAKAQVEAARSEAREADAAATGARGAVRTALARLHFLGAAAGRGNRVRITAAIGGEVHTRPANVGQVVAAGEPLCTVVNTGTVWVESDVFEKDLSRMREGQRVTIAADAVPGRTFSGTISSIEAEVDPQTRAVHVRTVVPNPGGLLKPNMFVRVVIASGGGQSVAVPAEAVQEQDGESVVFVVEAEGSYRRRAVRTGPTLGDQVVIEAGVNPGERVVTRGAYQLLAKVRR